MKNLVFIWKILISLKIKWKLKKSIYIYNNAAQLWDWSSELLPPPPIPPNIILPEYHPPMMESVPGHVSRAGAYSRPITWCGNSCFLIRASGDLVGAVVLLFLQSFSAARPALSSRAFPSLHFNNSTNFLCRGPFLQDFFSHEPPR